MTCLIPDPVEETTIGVMCPPTSVRGFVFKFPSLLCELCRWPERMKTILFDSYGVATLIYEGIFSIVGRSMTVVNVLHVWYLY